MPTSLPNSFTTKVDDRYLSGYDTSGRKTGPRLRETRVAAQSTYGTPIPVSSGYRPLWGNIIWSEALEEFEYEDGQQLSYEYQGTFAVSFGYNLTKSANTNVVAIWMDGQLVYDTRKTNRVQASWLKFRFYPGTETQKPDPKIIAGEGAGNVSAYRGQIYVVFEDLPLGAYDNKIPAVKILVSDTAVSADTESLAASGSSNNRAFVADWNRELLYVINKVTGTDEDLFVYDLATKAFIEARPLNQNDPTHPGSDSLFNLDFIPWLNRCVMINSRVSTGRDAVLINPDTGLHVAKASSPNQVQTFVPHYVDTPFGRYTYLLAYGVTHAIDIFQIDPAGSFTLVKSSLAKPTGTSGTFHRIAGPRDERTCTFYFGSDGDDTVHQLVITPTLIGIDNTQAFLVTEDVFQNPDGDGTTELRGMVYDRLQNQLIVTYADLHVHKWDITTDTVIWSIDDLPAAMSTSDHKCYLHDITGGYWTFLAGSGLIMEVDLTRGEWKSYSNTSGTIQSRNALSSSRWNMVVGTGLANGVVSVNRYRTLSNSRLNLGDLLEDLAVDVGYTDAEVVIDTTLTDQVTGFLTDKTGTLIEILEPIRSVYGLEILETGTTLKIQARNKGVAAPNFSITEDELIADIGDEPFELELTEEQSIPTRVNVTYIEPELGYNFATQTAFRSGQTRATDTAGQVTWNLPLVITADEAKYGAYNTLYNPWISQKTASFTLPPEYMRVEPGDIISITYNSVAYTLKVVEWQMNEDFTVTITAETFQFFEDFTISAFFGTPYDQELPTVLGQNLVRLYVFELPPLWDADEVSGISATIAEPSGLVYVVPTPGILTNSWGGADVYWGEALGSQYQYNPNGADATNKIETEAVAVPAGTVLTDITVPARRFAYDPFATMRVSIEVGDTSLLTTASSVDDLFEGANMALVGTRGRWTIISFNSVADNGDGTFTLTGLLFDQRNTELNMGSAPGSVMFAAGSTNFVLLNQSWTKKVYYQAVTNGQPISNLVFRFKARGESGRNAGVVTHIKNNVSLKNPLVHDIHVERSATGRHVIKWNPRSRLRQTLVDSTGDVTFSPWQGQDFGVFIKPIGSQFTQGVVYNAQTQSVTFYEDDETTVKVFSAPWKGLRREVMRFVSDIQQISLEFSNLKDFQWNWEIYKTEVDGVFSSIAENTITSGDYMFDPDVRGWLTSVADADYRNRFAYDRLLVSVVHWSEIPALQGDTIRDFPDQWVNDPNAALGNSPSDQWLQQYGGGFANIYQKVVKIEDV